jgi:hypothetical protein
MLEWENGEQAMNAGRGAMERRRSISGDAMLPGA